MIIIDLFIRTFRLGSVFVFNYFSSSVFCTCFAVHSSASVFLSYHLKKKRKKRALYPKTDICIDTVYTWISLISFYNNFATYLNTNIWRVIHKNIFSFTECGSDTNDNRKTKIKERMLFDKKENLVYIKRNKT